MSRTTSHADTLPASSDRLPVRETAVGPLYAYSMRVYDLYLNYRLAEGLRAADDYLRVAEAAGDARTVRSLLQDRTHFLVGLGRYEEAVRTGRDLLARYREVGATVAETRTLAEIAKFLFLWTSDRMEDGLQALAAALSLVNRCDPEHEQYPGALHSIAIAAYHADLYEVTAHVSTQVLAALRKEKSDRVVFELNHAQFLIVWALRLEQVGHDTDAFARFRSAADVAGASLYRLQTEPGQAPGLTLWASALLGLSLAKLGETDRVVDLLGPLIVTMRETGPHEMAKIGHLAYGMALRARGDLRAAARELAAAEELCDVAGHDAFPSVVQYELALLAAAEQPGEGTRRLLAAVRGQAQQAWRLRLQRVTMLRQAQRQLDLEAERAHADELASQDPLTGIGNRRRFDRELATVDLGTAHHAGPLTLVLVDLDEFKQTNDSFSHSVGDQVLVVVAMLLRNHCRSQDVPVRIGGDEFALFVRAELAEAVVIAERIRQAVHGHAWHQLAPGLRVTISTGVAALAATMSGRELFDAADASLYRAKHGGRNLVVS